MTGRRRGFRFVLGLAVSAGFVYYMALELEWQLFLQHLASARPAYLLVALALLAVDYFLRLYRWHRMLRVVGSTAGLVGCARPFLIGFALNNLLPMRAGDIARAVAFRRTLGVPVASTTATLLVERLLDLLVLLAIVGISVAYLPNDANFFANTLGAAPVAVAAAIFALAAAISIGLVVVSRASTIKSKAATAGRLHFQAGQWLGALGEALLYFPRLRIIAPLAGLSIVIWCIEAGVFVAVAWSLNMNSAGIWLAMGLGNIGTLLPGSPGHVGTFDFFTMAGIMAHGTRRTLAAAFAVLVHVLLWLPLTSAGLLLIIMPAPTQRETANNEGDPDVA